MHAEYLLLLAACLAITLPLELVLGARVYGRPRALLTALVPVIVLFLAWDLIGFERGHWGYVSARISGILLPGGLPVEELLFFVVIPICALLTFEAVRRILARLLGRRPGRSPGPPPGRPRARGKDRDA